MAVAIDPYRRQSQHKYVPPILTGTGVGFLVLIGLLGVKYNTNQLVPSFSDWHLHSLDNELMLQTDEAATVNHRFLLENSQKISDDTSDQASQKQAAIDAAAERPIMYTYYEPATTDMTEDADNDLLENWKNAWFDAGWQPKVLTEDDARKVPEYQELVDLVMDKKHIGGYNMACYIRWIAMVSVGGGFMADYDTFPLNHFLRHGRDLPFDGQMTVWAGHVPALVSGNGHEYFRIAKQIGRSMRKHVLLQKEINEKGPTHLHRNHLPWSDMLALSELYNKVSTDMFIMRRQVLNGADALQNMNWSEHECRLARGMRAVHFSHKAIAVGKQVYRGAIHRGTVARKFLNMWHKNCKYTPVEDETV
mmetsp:Transcript_2917/g.4724  ORF Transcript_2917/g.4724 Transcript_2917/m.4724 type:complete len:363 (+) Transcript_2917:43-1131(+)|eukprot:CAMPEP_0119007278 /NCGR_PEP_ID=MMETSP1176-20130426/2902_1 /TAXON_ID=265551 /ORGANISM="Synedropsis recta cf, Strain CCMP1620" /LENGTH=362 /DNA_ID=CAMNT_0006959393 /DNA_START=37 /DNA_END=1125 /DNA_ORIENTATION=-